MMKGAVLRNGLVARQITHSILRQLGMSPRDGALSVGVHHLTNRHFTSSVSSSSSPSTSGSSTVKAVRKDTTSPSSLGSIPVEEIPFSGNKKKPLSLTTSSAENSDAPVLVDSSSVPQAPNHESAWSESQMPKLLAMTNPRFEQTNLSFQPNPLSAQELIAKVPVTMVAGRKATCDGGGGALGHPKVYINLDQKVPVSCGYCGLRFQMKDDHHH